MAGKNKSQSKDMATSPERDDAERGGDELAREPWLIARAAEQERLMVWWRRVGRWLIGS